MNTIVGYRKMIGKTQKQMADIIGIGEVAYRMKENGQSEFKKSEMIRFYEVVNLMNPSITFGDIFLV